MRERWSRRRVNHRHAAPETSSVSDEEWEEHTQENRSRRQDLRYYWKNMRRHGRRVSIRERAEPTPDRRPKNITRRSSLDATRGLDLSDRVRLANRVCKLCNCETAARKGERRVLASINAVLCCERQRSMFSAQLRCASLNQGGFAGGKAVVSTTCEPLWPIVPVSSQTSLQKLSIWTVDHCQRSKYVSRDKPYLALTRWMNW